MHNKGKGRGGPVLAPGMECVLLAALLATLALALHPPRAWRTSTVPAAAVLCVMIALKQASMNAGGAGDKQPKTGKSGAEAIANVLGQGPAHPMGEQKIQIAPPTMEDYSDVDQQVRPSPPAPPHDHRSASTLRCHVHPIART